MFSECNKDQNFDSKIEAQMLQSSKLFVPEAPNQNRYRDSHIVPENENPSTRTKYNRDPEANYSPDQLRN